MSYIRFGFNEVNSSHYYIFHNSDSGITKGNQKLSIWYNFLYDIEGDELDPIFNPKNQQIFTYNQLKKMVRIKDYSLVQGYLQETQHQQNIVKIAIFKFIKDVNKDYNFFFNGIYRSFKSKYFPNGFWID